MPRHRLEPPPRPRYARLALVGASASVTVVAVLGGTGLVPSLAGSRADVAVDPAAGAAAGGALLPAAYPQVSPGDEAPAPAEARPPAARVAPTPATEPEVETPVRPAAEPGAPESVPLPGGSGSGRRVVFSEGQQRVWLVTAAGRVTRTYLVSGSIHDNLDPGTYAVYSRSEDAWGIDGSTMRLFVRFTRGTSAAIGFHTIPLLGGRRVQTVAELGTPTSHGCIRQRTRDARAMWRFAEEGTTVVVVA